MKYGNKKVTVDGIKFDSKKEADRYTELKLLEKAGKIHGLELQKVFELIPAQYEEKFTGERYKKGVNKGAPKLKKVCLEKAVTYKADFCYFVNNGHNTFVVEDTKGMRTKDYIIKRKLMLYVHQIKIKEV